jgi:autotransporter-associated beta strand protein
MNKISLSSVLVACILLPTSPAIAGSSVWQSSPPTNDWDTASNWTPATVPNGSADTATFNTSSTAMISISANTQVNSFTFNGNASAFTITATPDLALTISGVGITNNSGLTQNFVTAVNGAGSFGTIRFQNNATAGSMTSFTNNGSTVSGADGGRTIFNDSSTAGSATITNNDPGGAPNNGMGGWTFFNNSSNAGTATITNSGGTTDLGTADVLGGTHFYNTSSASTAVINNTSFGYLIFYDSSTAASATVTNNGLSMVIFKNNSTAANATLTNVLLAAQMQFQDNSTASHATINNTNPVTAVYFRGNSTADHAFINNFNSSGFSGGILIFGNQPDDQSSAGNATILNNGIIGFSANATAGNATITNQKFGTVTFSGSSSEGSAFIDNKIGGVVNLLQMATADGLTIVNESGARVDISDFSSFASASVGVGSLSGAGNVFLGKRNLTLGGLNRNETISGIIADGGQFGGTAGSLTKVGTGILSLTNANTYSGGTFINGGTLIAAHDGALGGGNVSLTASCVHLGCKTARPITTSRTQPASASLAVPL